MDMFEFWDETYISKASFFHGAQFKMTTLTWQGTKISVITSLRIHSKMSKVLDIKGMQDTDKTSTVLEFPESNVVSYFTVRWEDLE